MFKKENRASLKFNFMSHDYNKRLMMKTINSSSQRSKHQVKKMDEENLSSSQSDNDNDSRKAIAVSASQRDLKQVINRLSAKNCILISENFDKLSSKQQMDRIEEALIDNGSMISPSSKKQMSEIFNSTHNFKQLKQILRDNQVHSIQNSIRSSNASQVTESPPQQQSSSKKMSATLNVNSKKLNDFVICSPAVK